MADKVDVQVTGKSEAEIAYMLMRDIMSVEKKNAYQGGSSGEAASRDYLLQTFSACMLAVKQPGYYSG